MNKKDYFDVRDTAWRVLIETSACRLPIKIAPICKAMGAKALSYLNAREQLAERGLMELTNKTDGFTYRGRDGYYIFYDSSTTQGRQRFTIGHELGHIALEHLKVGEVTLRNREPEATDDENEKAANMFAARILAPACVLHFADIISAEDIALACDISDKASKFRAERLEVLRQRGLFLTSPLEKQVFTYFKVFIEEANPGMFLR